jgi:transposase
MRLEARSLDQLIPQSHRARALWLASEKLDLSAFYAEIEAVEAGPGRPAIDPRILLVLWLYAISEGVGSARQLSRLCKEHDAYRWITGGLEICHRVLSDFRVHHGEKLDQLLSELLAALMRAGVVTLRTVAQDGTRVRASAGAASFRSKKSLQKCLREAKRQVQTLKTQLDDEDDTTEQRKRAARERAAREREESVELALEALKEVEESRRRHGKKSEPRASTTDPDARVMKMADGGFRPAYNCQLATDVDSRLIVACRASNSGGDMGQVESTVEEIRRRLEAKPESYLVDGGYAKRESIDQLTDEQITVYAPPQHNPKTRDPNKPRQRIDSA